jgi:hypothetical protein
VRADAADRSDRADIHTRDTDVTLYERDPLHVVEQRVHDLGVGKWVGLRDPQPGPEDSGNQHAQPDQSPSPQHARLSLNG